MRTTLRIQMSRSMDFKLKAMRCLQMILMFVLLNICSCWPQNVQESENFDLSSDDDTVVIDNALSEPSNHNCSWPAIWYPQSNWCERLLSKAACDDNQWLVLDTNNVPQCQTRVCPDKQIMYKGECTVIGSTDKCPLGMHIVALETGHGDCDCKNGHVYWSHKTIEDQEARCYELYRRGPCPVNKLLYISDEDGKVRCRVTRCQDGEVDLRNRNGKISVVEFGRARGRCIQLGTKGPCAANLVVGIDSKTMQLSCLKSGLTLSRTLINAPTLDCGPGSKRDTLGKCRRSMF